MKTKLLRIVSFLLALAMAFSLVSCKDNKKKKRRKKKQATTSQVADTGSDYSSGSYSNGWDEDDWDEDEDDNYGIIIARPDSDSDMKNGIASGKKLTYNDSANDDDDDDDIDDDDIDDIDDGGEDQFDPEVCVADISQYGSPLLRTDDPDTRTINVKNNTVVYKHFDAVGGNIYPTWYTHYSQHNNKCNSAYIELNYKRFNDVTPKITRSWWQIDWMLTNDAGKNYPKYESDPTTNPDYINYNNGNYFLSEDNELMESCIKYWKMLEESDTHIYVAFGWKVATRIQSWFSEDPSRPRISAPKDLDRYADAAEKMFLYCQDRGLTNVDILAYYNEPAQRETSKWRGSWDYATVGDKRIYYTNMVRAAYKKFSTNERLKNVRIASADVSAHIYELYGDLVDVYMMQQIPEMIDMLTRHEYPAGILSRSPGGDDLYSPLFECFTTFRWFFSPNQDGKDYYDFYITEAYFYSMDATGTDYYWNDAASYWNVSTTAYMLAAANTGCHSVFTWSIVGGTLQDPSSFLVGDDNCSAWRTPLDYDSSLNVLVQYYEYCLWNNYIPDDANVYDLTWKGEDCRAGAFSSPDGKDFSLLVEKSYNTNLLTFDVNLEKSLGGKTIYVYRVTNADYDDVNVDAQATIPVKQTSIANVNTTFSYTEDAAYEGEYAVYVFTTIKPLKQVELYHQDGTQAVVTNVGIDNIDTAIDFSATLLDCEPTDTVTWEIMLYTNAAEKITNPEDIPDIPYYYNKIELKEFKRVYRDSNKGTLTPDNKSATYKFPEDAKVGDVVAIRCTIDDGTPADRHDDRYASAVIEVVK